MSPLSIVIPVLNDAPSLARLLAAIRGLEPHVEEIVVVDGGSADRSRAVASERADIVIDSAPGRGRQLAVGIERAKGVTIWMLHADAEIDVRAWHALLAAHRDGATWGRFDVRFTSPAWWYRVIERAMNVRSRLTGICTGDQGIFVTRDALERIGGMPVQSLMEDIELCRRLKRLAPPTCLAATLGASPRRWETHGVLRTILFMWEMRLRYFLGASPETLVRRYYAR